MEAKSHFLFGAGILPFGLEDLGEREVMVHGRKVRLYHRAIASSEFNSKLIFTS